MGRYKLAGENATDFPKIPEVTDGYNVDISTDVLTNAISNTIFATSNDELRPAMTGVYFNLSSTNATFVATRRTSIDPIQEGGCGLRCRSCHHHSSQSAKSSKNHITCGKFQCDCGV